jgi:hypothetical protein
VTAEHPDAAPLAEHPVDRALRTWEAWSSADVWRRIKADARKHGQDLSGLDLERLTSGPDPLEALRANREVVQTMTGWQWQAMRAAREQQHGWDEIGGALGLDPEQVKRAYLERVERQRLAAERTSDLGPLLRYDPRWRELADDNDADRAHQARARGARPDRREGDRER